MDRTITTVGHSNHELGRFVQLLRGERIEHVVDVRSQAYSRFAPQFNYGAIRSWLNEHGIEYTHDTNLGGRPESADMYDAAGHVLYGRLAVSIQFKGSLDRLEATATSSKVAIMCGEEDPTECHWRVLHLRGDGRLMPEDLIADVAGGAEPGLFEGGEFSAWRSIRSVSHKIPPRSSSES
jgi:uncharacterized protein (DUF488 family)